jgi:hypothetical protein
MIFSLLRYATRLSLGRRNWLPLFLFLSFDPATVSDGCHTSRAEAFFRSIAIVEIEWGVFVQALTRL